MSEPTAVSHDWTTSVKKYVPNANDAVIHGIVKHLGIALRGKDSSFVACTDKAERDLVRDHFLKKKLGLALDDPELDRGVTDVCQRMHAERDKPRVTFYYLLAEKYDKLSMFT
jgi:Protein of unknown function (DUF2853)